MFLWDKPTRLGAFRQSKAAAAATKVLAANQELYGGATASRKILFVQALPVVLGLILLFLSRAP
jgi:putative membrane protein